MHSSAVLPKDTADGICCHLFRGICTLQIGGSPEIFDSPARQGDIKDQIVPQPAQPESASAMKGFIAG
jgi:hypothetical protein